MRQAECLSRGYGTSPAARMRNILYTFFGEVCIKKVWLPPDSSLPKPPNRSKCVFTSVAQWPAKRKDAGVSGMSHFVSTEFSISKNGTLRSSSLDSCMLALAFCAAGLFAVVAIVGVKAGCSVDCCARVCLFKKPMNCTGGRLLFSDKRRSCSESRGP